MSYFPPSAPSPEPLEKVTHTSRRNIEPLLTIMRKLRHREEANASKSHYLLAIKSDCVRKNRNCPYLMPSSIVFTPREKGKEKINLSLL